MEEDLKDQEQAAQVVMQPSWIFKLNKHDTGLMLRALGGRLADDEDRAQAKDLCDQLTIKRQGEMSSHAKGIELAAAAAQGLRQVKNRRP